MGKIAFVFAGQGAQHIGMGRELYASSPAVKNLFDEAEARRPGTLALMFEGDETELKKTANTQPCLYLADLAAAAALREAGIVPDAVAGFSLGEIPALAFAGAYSDAEGFALACVRGAAMGKAAEAVSASMAAIVKMTNEQVEAICSRFEQVYPVNYNCPGQLVVSARTDVMKEFCDAVKAEGGRALSLNVSGGFHSPFMNDAAAEFGAYLVKADIRTPELPAYSNYTADLYGDEVKQLLEMQIQSPVRWEGIIRKMAADGFDTFVECGPGSTLSKLIAKILPDARTFAVETAEQAEAAAKELSA
ncbi:MAG: ACP S-malonyltransferase [Clostridia bacterium]|nr:ACP S-malonyltransferase [Clostridia bacterium]